MRNLFLVARRFSIKRIALSSFSVALSFCVLYAMVKLCVMQVSSGSMENTLYDGDYLLIVKSSGYGYEHWWNVPRLSRGDIIVFRSPVNANELAVKRIIGVPGDYLSIQKGNVMLNGSKLEEPYVRWEYGYSPAANHWPVGADALHPKAFKVPGGAYFVLGDNRAVSSDSRVLGPIPMRNIIGIVILRTHRSRWSFVSSPAPG